MRFRRRGFALARRVLPHCVGRRSGLPRAWPGGRGTARKGNDRPRACRAHTTHEGGLRNGGGVARAPRSGQGHPCEPRQPHGSPALARDSAPSARSPFPPPDLGRAHARGRPATPGSRAQRACSRAEAQIGLIHAELRSPEHQAERRPRFHGFFRLRDVVAVPAAHQHRLIPRSSPRAARRAECLQHRACRAAQDPGALARAGELCAKGIFQEIFQPPRPARQTGARDPRRRARALGRALIRISALSESGCGRRLRHEPEGDTTRVLDIEELGSSVRKRVGLLRKGETPAALGLGEDVTAPLAESLLTMLYRRWCEDKQSRAHPRHSSSGTAQICSGMAAVHYFVTGRVLSVRGGPQKISQVQHEQIATLGRVATLHEDEPSPTPDFAVETWRIMDESASGLRLARVDAAASSRLMLGQLLGIRLSDAKAFLLCAVKWLSVSVEFELRAGVHILPGIPQGAAIRPIGAPAAAEQYTPAFLLPAVAALQAPETLVVPAGWFKPNREGEVLTERNGKLRPASVIERGAAFRAGTFEALSGPPPPPPPP